MTCSGNKLLLCKCQPDTAEIIETNDVVHANISIDVSLLETIHIYQILSDCIKQCSAIIILYYVVISHLMVALAQLED